MTRSQPAPDPRDAAFDAALVALDCDAIRALLDQGYDLNSLDRYGDTVLERLLAPHIPGDPGAQPRPMVLTMLRQLVAWGVDPRVLNDEQGSALVMALFRNDGDLAATLLALGVDPNRGPGMFDGQTLLNLAIYDYEYETSEAGWLALDAQPPDQLNPDAWLAYLVRASAQEGRKGPEVAVLMRRGGATTGEEIVATLGGDSSDRAQWTAQGWRLAARD